MASKKKTTRKAGSKTKERGKRTGPWNRLDILDRAQNDDYIRGGIFDKSSIGSEVEFFDDHQKWMIESYDDL